MAAALNWRACQAPIGHHLERAEDCLFLLGDILRDLSAVIHQRYRYRSVQGDPKVYHVFTIRLPSNTQTKNTSSCVVFSDHPAYAQAWDL